MLKDIVEFINTTFPDYSYSSRTDMVNAISKWNRYVLDQIRDEYKERGLGGSNMIEIPPAEAAAKLRDAATELRKFNSIAHANWLEDIARMMEQ